MDELHRCNSEEVERVTREMQDEDLDEVYSFLMGPHLKRLEIARKENIIAELRRCLLPGAIRYDKDRVQSTPSDQLSETMAKIDEMEKQVARLRADRSALIIQVNSMIEKLENDIERAVLTEWYINRERPSLIAENIGYSERQMYRYKNDGVRHLARILKDVSECQ